MRPVSLPASVVALALAGCATTPPAAERAVATLRTASGAEVGTVSASPMGGGVHVSLAVRGLNAGIKGAHIHAVGRCDAPDFATAGGHWNPTGAKHGTMHGPGHAGDLPNLTVAPDGTGRLEAHAPAGTFAQLLDADGAAFVVHAGPDDMMTDPAGNSGPRIACGVFGRG
jgi:superoxide dismutase, Cu-Zn family